MNLSAGDVVAISGVRSGLLYLIVRIDDEDVVLQSFETGKMYTKDPGAIDLVFVRREPEFPKVLAQLINLDRSSR